MAIIDNVLVNTEDVLVIGGPAAITLSLDFGKQGSRGTKIFSADSTPTAYFTLEVNQSLDIQLYDMFLNTLTNDLYQYVNTPESYSWQLIGNLAGDAGPAGSQGPAGPAGEGIPADGLEGQILVKLSDTDYDTGWIDNFATSTKHLVKNNTGASMSKGSVVYISGADGTNILVSLADADTEMTSSKTVGFLETNLDQGDHGYVVTSGLLAGINTSGATAAGQAIWLSSTAGQFVYGSPPAEPAHSVYLGVVSRKHAVQGEIFIHVSNGWELDEIHGVSVPSPVANDLLYYASDGLWKNSTIAALGIVKTGSTTNKVANNMLDNSTITIGSTSTSLGATSASLEGLTNVTATDTTTTAKLRVTNGSASSIAAPTGFMIGSNTASNYAMIMDPDSIQTSYNATSGPLFVNPEGGAISLGKSDGTAGGVTTFGATTIASATGTTTIGKSDNTQAVNVYGTVDILGTLANGNVIAAGGSGAGTAPIKFTSSSGTVLSSPVDGAVEYDGTVFYATPMTSGGRALTQNSYEYVQNTARTVTTPAAAATGIFGAGSTTTGVGLTLPTGTYEFEMYVSETMTETATTHTLNMLFPCTGGTYAHINYTTLTATASMLSANNTAVITNVAVSTAAAITGAATTAASITRSVIVKGNFRLSTGGVWTPQLQFSAAGGVSGNLVINTGSFVRVTPVGTSTTANTSVGAWG